MDRVILYILKEKTGLDDETRIDNEMREHLDIFVQLYAACCTMIKIFVAQHVLVHIDFACRIGGAEEGFRQLLLMFYGGYLRYGSLSFTHVARQHLDCYP